MISVSQITKQYEENTALRGVSFTIPTGQICGYLGPNGAGKSTTVRILTGLLKPTSGHASIAGFDVQQHPLEVKKRIGYVPDTGAIYETLSVTEYLTLVGALHKLPPQTIDDRSQYYLQLFDLDEAANRRIDNLSKGMRQKVVIASALIHEPDVLLFDEPLTGLDAHTALKIKDIVRGFADQGKTVLYCSHVLDVVERLCDRVIVLDQGAIVADGLTDELIRDNDGETLEQVFRHLTGPGSPARKTNAETKDRP